MSCFVPPQYRHLKWHVIKTNLLPDEPEYEGFYERAEWVNDERNGPTEGGHWVRWGYCGGFPSLCLAKYIGPALDQESDYVIIDEQLAGKVGVSA
jgi:hypothetical protein